MAFSTQTVKKNTTVVRTKHICINIIRSEDHKICLKSTESELYFFQTSEYKSIQFVIYFENIASIYNYAFLRSTLKVYSKLFL